MEIRHATQRGCVIVAFTGSIDLASVAQVQRVLLKHLAEQPPAVICDLAGVRYLDPVFATVFTTVANHPASGWPTGLLLCAAQPQVAQVLHRVQPAHLVRLYDSAEEAVDAALARPPRLRDELRLAPIPSAAAAARAFVWEVCQSWQLARPDGTLVERAVLVANELVTHAVVHARTDLWLGLELRADRLFIAVRDGSPRLLRTVPAGWRLRGAGGCGWWSSWLGPGGSGPIPRAARSSGARSTSEPHARRDREWQGAEPGPKNAPGPCSLPAAAWTGRRRPVGCRMGGDQPCWE